MAFSGVEVKLGLPAIVSWQLSRDFNERVIRSSPRQGGGWIELHPLAITHGMGLTAHRKRQLMSCLDDVPPSIKRFNRERECGGVDTVTVGADTVAAGTACATFIADKTGSDETTFNDAVSKAYGGC